MKYQEALEEAGMRNLWYPGRERCEKADYLAPRVDATSIFRWEEEACPKDSKSFMGSAIDFTREFFGEEVVVPALKAALESGPAVRVLQLLSLGRDEASGTGQEDSDFVTLRQKFEVVALGLAGNNAVQLSGLIGRVRKPCTSPELELS